MEVCGGRDGGVWEGRRCMVGVVEECGGRGKVCGECGRGGDVWEGVRCVEGSGGVWEGYRW